MITEQAILSVIPGQEDAFERAFAAARVIISSMPGFRGISLSRSIESPNEYLLLVRWNSLEDHTVGLRGSTEYAEWRELLHRFYSPFPTVEHFVEVQSVPGAEH